MVKATKNAWLSLGNGDFSRAESERSSLAFRRSIYFVRDLKAGQIITPEDIRRIRPGFGLPPKFYDDVVGKKVNIDVTVGDPVSFEKIK